MQTQMKSHIMQCAPFHQCLHYLLRQNQSYDKEIQGFFYILQPVAPRYIHDLLNGPS